MNKLESQHCRTPIGALALIAAATFALAACDRAGDDRTVGQQTDAAVAAAKNEGAATMNRAGEAMDKAGAAMSDAAITASVNAELAKDSTLSALKIDVDTSNGRVALKGSAPDAAARERATTLASSVKGVVSVDNQLEVRS